MKHFRIHVLALLALALSAFSCDKDNLLGVQKDVAVLTWSGSYAVDGCGFSIQLKESKYKPENEEELPDTLKRYEAMEVEIKYVLPDKKVDYTCGMARKQADAIRILSIKEI